MTKSERKQLRYASTIGQFTQDPTHLCATVDDQCPEGDEESVESVNTDFLMSMRDSFDHDLEKALGSDLINVTLKQHFIQRRNSSGFNGAIVDGDFSEEDEESTVSVGTDFTLNDSIIRQFGVAFGRDSILVNQDRKNGQRRRSRASIKGVTIEFAPPDEGKQLAEEL
eukprot:15354062-Ditylum_brightwellii.AAC.1